MKLIQSITLSSNANTITFSSIPQDGTDLILLTSLRATSDTLQKARARFNNVSTSIYKIAYIQDSNGSFSANLYTDTYCFIAGAGSNLSSGVFGTNKLHIMDYTNSSYKKPVHGQGASQDGSTRYSYLTGTVFDTTAAITSLEISFNSNQIASGSTASLYSITKA